MNVSPAPGILLPATEKGIGKIIAAPQSKDLISGVLVEAVALWPDDRGFFLEVARFGEGLVDAFPAATTQISAASNYPGAIKAFHYHLHQTDVWVAVQGMLQVALVDLRPDSPTFGLKNTIYTGKLKPLRILIPPRVGHGYKVIGTEPSVLVYLTDRFYDPADEGRIAYNDAGINYDWELQHK